MERLDLSVAIPFGLGRVSTKDLRRQFYCSQCQSVAIPFGLGRVSTKTKLNSKA